MGVLGCYPGAAAWLAVARQPYPRLSAATAPRFSCGRPNRYVFWKNKLCVIASLREKRRHLQRVPIRVLENKLCVIASLREKRRVSAMYWTRQRVPVIAIAANPNVELDDALGTWIAAGLESTLVTERAFFGVGGVTVFHFVASKTDRVAPAAIGALEFPGINRQIPGLEKVVFAAQRTRIPLRVVRALAVGGLPGNRSFGCAHCGSFPMKNGISRLPSGKPSGL